MGKIASYDFGLKIKDSIDMLKKEHRDMDDFCDMKKISISEFLDDCFKSVIKNSSGTKNIDTLMSRNKKYKEAIYSIKTEIKEVAGIPRQGFSRAMREEVKRRIEDED